jgi:hypothetical protein
MELYINGKLVCESKASYEKGPKGVSARTPDPELELTLVLAYHQHGNMPRINSSEKGRVSVHEIFLRWLQARTVSRSTVHHLHVDQAILIYNLIAATVVA